jgi:hypothetical protein
MKFRLKQLLVLVFVVLFTFVLNQGQALASDVIFERIVRLKVLSLRILLNDYRGHGPLLHQSPIFIFAK